MRNLKFGFVLLLFTAVFACENHDMVEETQPTEITLDGQRSIVIQEEPVVPSAEAVISVWFPDGFDRLQFMQDYGDELGLIKARQCETSPNLEVWRVDYITHAELGTILNSILYDVMPVYANTTSNGTGANPVHPPYRTRTAPPQPPGQPQGEYSSEIWFYYGDVCD